MRLVVVRIVGRRRRRRRVETIRRFVSVRVGSARFVLVVALGDAQREEPARGFTCRVRVYVDALRRSRRRALAREARHGGFPRRRRRRGRPVRGHLRRRSPTARLRVREDEHARGVTHVAAGRAQACPPSARGRPTLPRVVLAEKMTTLLLMMMMMMIRIRRGGRGYVRLLLRPRLRVRGDVGKAVRRDDRGGVGRGVGVHVGNARRVVRVVWSWSPSSSWSSSSSRFATVAELADSRTSGGSAEVRARSRAASASAAAAYRSASARALAYSSDRRRAVSRAAATAAFARAIGSSPRAGSPESVDDASVVGGKSARCAPTLDAAAAGSVARGGDGDAPRDDALARSSGRRPSRARGVRGGRVVVLSNSRATTAASLGPRAPPVGTASSPSSSSLAPSPSAGSSLSRRVARLGPGATQRRPQRARSAPPPQPPPRRHNGDVRNDTTTPCWCASGTGDSASRAPALAHLRPLKPWCTGIGSAACDTPCENPEAPGRAQRRRRGVRLIDGKRCARRGRRHGSGKDAARWMEET